VFAPQDQTGAGGWLDKGRLVRSYPFTHSGETMAMLTVPGQPRLVVFFDQAVGATYTAEVGTGPHAPYVFTVNGSPVRVNDGTYPNGLSGTMGYAWKFNGTSDYLSLSDSASGDDFDPSGDFSVVCAVNGTTGDQFTGIFSKWKEPTNQRTWMLYRGGNLNFYFYVSKDGITQTAIYRSGCASGQIGFATGSYHYISDGNSIMQLCANANNCYSISNAPGPPFNSSTSINVGMYDSSIYRYFSGQILFCAYYDGIFITQAQHEKMHAMFRGMIDSAAQNTVSTYCSTCSAIMLAPPYSGVQPFLMQLPSYTNMVGSPASGSGGLYGASAITNLVPYSTFESWASGVPTGWTETVTSTGDCAQTTDHMAVGASSALCTLADADDAVSLTTGCLTVSASTLYELSVWAKLISGTGKVDIDLLEYSDTGCATLTTTTSVVNDAVPGLIWTRLGGTQNIAGTITTQASTQRAQFRIALPAGAAQSVAIDAAMMRAVGNYPKVDAFCGANAAGSAACSPTIISTASPFSANGATTATFNFRIPYSGSEIAERKLFFTNGGYGSANSFVVFIRELDKKPQVCLFDNALGTRCTNLTNPIPSANTDYQTGFYSSGNNDVACYWNGAWNNQAAGSGTGKLSAAQSYLYFVNPGTSFAYDIWLNSFRVYRGVLR